MFLGQIETVADATGTRSLEHCYCGKLSEETLDATFYGDRVLTYKLDGTTLGAIGRTAGFTLGTAGDPDSDYNVSYGFDAYGRFQLLTDVAQSRTFAYGYLSDASFVETLAVPTGGHAFTVTRSYEPERDLLGEIRTDWDSTVRVRYDYAHNALGQRESRKQSGDVFGDYGELTFARFGYNPRGELISAPQYAGDNVNSTDRPLPGRQHRYEFDSIGNRKWADRTGDPLRREDYPEVNSLNQYVRKENHTIPVQGTVATAGTGAAVAGSAATERQGRYFAAELPVSNATTPWYGPLTILAAVPGAGGGGADLVRTETRLASIPPATQVFTYDLDGNMTSDGIWDFSYDAENRLIRMSTVTNALAGGFPDRTLEFKYDYLGRRVQKRVIDNSATPGTDVRARYVYEGWNLIAEYDLAPGTSNLSLQRSYHWGLDLTGDLTKAGGVGALVQIRDHVASKNFLPAYDGNGNVAALLDAADGTAAAVYEYSPFGELIRSTGTYAHENPFRFSTKFTDDETGLVYYGRRYYDPATGRFPSRDPVEEKGGLNLYAMVWNNPVNRWDYLGMCGRAGEPPCDGAKLPTYEVKADRLSSSKTWTGGGVFRSGGGWDTSWDSGWSSTTDDGQPDYEEPQKSPEEKLRDDLLDELCGTESGRKSMEIIAKAGTTVRFYHGGASRYGGFSADKAIYLNIDSTNDIIGGRFVHEARHQAWDAGALTEASRSAWSDFKTSGMTDNAALQIFGDTRYVLEFDAYLAQANYEVERGLSEGVDEEAIRDHLKQIGVSPVLRWDSSSGWVYTPAPQAAAAAAQRDARENAIEITGWECP